MEYLIKEKTVCIFQIEYTSRNISNYHFIVENYRFVCEHILLDCECI